MKFTQPSNSPRFIKLNGDALEQSLSSTLTASRNLAPTLLMTTSAIITTTVSPDVLLTLSSTFVAACLVPYVSQKVKMFENMVAKHAFENDAHDKIIDKAPPNKHFPRTNDDYRKSYSCSVEHDKESRMSSVTSIAAFGAAGLITATHGYITKDFSTAALTVLTPFAMYHAASAFCSRIANNRYNKLLSGEWEMVSRQEAKQRIQKTEPASAPQPVEPTL